MIGLIRMFLAANLLRLASKLIPETADTAPARAYLRRAGEDLMRVAMADD